MALFFALITLGRRKLYAVLKALGATSRDLLGGVTVQALGVALGALLLAAALAVGLVSALSADLPLRVEPVRVAAIAVGTLVTAVTGALFTLRRILRIESGRVHRLTLTHGGHGARTRARTGAQDLRQRRESHHRARRRRPHGRRRRDGDPHGAVRQLLTVAGALLRPDAGAVRVGGRDITGNGSRDLARFRREQVGFVFQNVNLVPFLTARENLLAVREIGGRRRDRTPGAAPTPCSPSSASVTAQTACRTSCPGASGSVSRSVGP